MKRQLRDGDHSQKVLQMGHIGEKLAVSDPARKKEGQKIAGRQACNLWSNIVRSNVVDQAM